MGKDKKINRRAFLKKAGKLIYLAPVINTFFTDTREALAQGQRAAAAREAALQRVAERLEALAEQGNQAAAQALQVLQERLVSPP